MSRSAHSRCLTYIRLPQTFLALLFVAGLAGIAPACAQPGGEITADEVKAAFLYRFVGYAEWPKPMRATDMIVIGVAGADAVQSALLRIAESGRDRIPPIAVREILSPDDMQGVHLIFIGAKENARLSKFVSLARNLPTPALIVSEAPDGLDRGSMINFVTGSRVRFEVSIGNATRAGIHLNARLLSVALRVKKGALWPDDSFVVRSLLRRLQHS